MCQQCLQRVASAPLRTHGHAPPLQAQRVRDEGKASVLFVTTPVPRTQGSPGAEAACYCSGRDTCAPRYGDEL
ncbi:unnamed protein product [Lota lota]